MVVVRDPHIEKSNSVSPPALLADASYFLAPQEVTKKRCRATPPVLRLLAQPPARCPAFLAANGRFRTRSLRSLRHAEPETSVRGCDTRRRRRRGAVASSTVVFFDYRHLQLRGHPICLDGAEKRRAGRKKTRRMSERPQGSEFGASRPDRASQGTRRSLPGAF